MFALNVYQKQAPVIALMFKSREAAETVERELASLAPGLSTVYDNFSTTAKIARENITATAIVDIEADMERSAELEIMKVKVQMKAEQKMRADPAFSLLRGAQNIPFINGLPAANG